MNSITELHCGNHVPNEELECYHEIPALTAQKGGDFFSSGSRKASDYLTNLETAHSSQKNKVQAKKLRVTIMK